MPVSGPLKSRYLEVKEFILDDISWVDDIQGLHVATNHIKDCRVVGIDCEWKPNYEKGSKPSKVIFLCTYGASIFFSSNMFEPFFCGKWRHAHLVKTVFLCNDMMYNSEILKIYNMETF